MTTEIFVALPDEAVQVWRPISAEHVGGDRYLITEQPYDRSIEIWEFEPGEVVICRIIVTEDRSILAAVARAP
ncbi:MAG: hypothetical protein U0821_08585 [Chloroflexota bacterium]